MFPSLDNPTETFPYRVEGQVGIGSMGIVYRAVEVSLDRTVAIKVLRQSMLQGESTEVQEEIRQRFMQEARAAAALAHPGATTVYRVGEEQGVPYIVMEWLEGKPLDLLLEERSVFSVREATRLVMTLLDTLQAAHRNGVVHRDIKPSNLVLLEDGRLKVTDFGIARLQGRELVKTQAGVVLATPKFAAPEQLRGIDVDGRTDLFATGILLYRMLTGHYPFDGESFMQLATAILQTEPAPMREYVVEIPPQLEAVVRTALRKDRDKRFADAAAMAEALRPFSREGDGMPPLPRSRGADSEPLSAATARFGPVLQDAPEDMGLVLPWLAQGWPGRALERQPTSAVVERLLEKPLHTTAFSGAARIGDAYLLICDGVLVGAIDATTGEHGDCVVDHLAVIVSPTLHPLPEPFPPALVRLVSSLPHPPKLLHSDLDSALINLPSLAQRMRQNHFDGFLHLRRGQSYGLVFFHRGEDVLSVFSSGWDDVPIEQPWQQWVSRTSIRASVVEQQSLPLTLWYRHSLPDFELLAQTVEKRADDDSQPSPGATTSSRIRQLFQSSGRSNSLDTGQVVLQLSPQQEAGGGATHYQQAPAFQLLDWTLNQLPEYLAERQKTGPWKYLGDWLPLVRRARLHHTLPRPGSRQADTFDLVTFDDRGKVLHLAQHIAAPSVDQFDDFLERVLLAKTARIKTGDVGGVFLVASKLSDDVLSAYSERIQGVTGIFGLEDAFTGYAGFVRIGARRGFHLMLVEQQGDTFLPILPH